MNTSLQPTTRDDHTGNDWQLRPEVAAAMKRVAFIAEEDESAEITDHSITFQNYDERTTISVEPINVDTWDGHRVTECITIRTPLTSFKLFDEERYSTINAFATTGAIARDATGNDAIVSRLPLYEGDEVALAELYVPLIGYAALLQVIGPVSGLLYMQGRKEEVRPEDASLPDWNEPSCWDAREFECAEERLSLTGAYANSGASGLTVEFPWEQGAISSIVGDRTSLLRLSANQAHPAAGNGLLYRLELPMLFEDDEARHWAACLNRIEAESIDTPPLFGAWCTMPGSGAVSFVGFWPNVMYRPGTATNIAFWSWARSRFARQIIGNLH